MNLVEWLKMMVGTRRAEEVVDSRLEVKPSTRALKRSLLVALKCVDPEAEKRPKMSQVVRMLEADEYPFREVCSLYCLTLSYLTFATESEFLSQFGTLDVCFAPCYLTHHSEYTRTQ